MKPQTVQIVRQGEATPYWFLLIHYTLYWFLLIHYNPYWFLLIHYKSFRRQFLLL
ncbi:IS1106 transposase [Neisseria meningitidis]|nr:IS1106 transposase [Neisseria meningitidis]